MTRYKATRRGREEFTAEEETAANELVGILAAQAELNFRKECEEAIDRHIQSKIDAYNDENKLSLTDVKTCALYATVDGYTHKDFCAAVWAWNVDVWESARKTLDSALAGEVEIRFPEDVIAFLPTFSF